MIESVAWYVGYTDGRGPELSCGFMLRVLFTDHTNDFTSVLLHLNLTMQSIDSTSSDYSCFSYHIHCLWIGPLHTWFSWWVGVPCIASKIGSCLVSLCRNHISCCLQCFHAVISSNWVVWNSWREFTSTTYEDSRLSLLSLACVRLGMYKFSDSSRRLSHNDLGLLNISCAGYFLVIMEEAIALIHQTKRQVLFTPSTQI